MKIISILMTGLFAVFLTAVAIFAQDVAPVADGLTGELSDPLSDPMSDPINYYNPGKSGGGYYSPGGGYYKSGGGPTGSPEPPGPPWPPGSPDPPGPPWPPGGGHGVPEPSTIILLGAGLAVGGAYSFLRQHKDKRRK